MPTKKIPSHPKSPYFFGAAPGKQGEVSADQITDAFDTLFALKDTGDLAEGTNLYYTQARFDTAFGAKDTDDLTEGATNLYFTNARADARIALATLADLASASASDIDSGTLADARLSSNVPLLNAANVFTAVQTFVTRSHVGDGTGEARFDFLGAAGSTRGLFFGTGATLPGANRWFMFADSRAEAGSNAGSNLNIFRYPDGGGSPLGMPLFIERATGNMALLNGTSTALPGFGSGTNIMFLGDRTAAPSSNPSGGGFLYSESGALKWRGSSGTVTTIATA